MMATNPIPLDELPLPGVDPHPPLRLEDVPPPAPDVPPPGPQPGCMPDPLSAPDLPTPPLVAGGRIRPPHP